MASKWILLTDADRENIKFHCKVGSPLYKKMEKAEKRIKISSAKGKGRNLQQWLCEEISKLTGIPYTPGDDQSLIASRPMGQHGLDVILRGEALKAFPYSVECKSSEQLELVETIEQAKANEYKGTHWLILHKRKAIAKPIVIMEWNTFKGVLRERGSV